MLLLPGSGPVDRDENIKKLPVNVLREVAGHVAARGFASFRYDKRGVGRSEGDYWHTGFYDHVADALGALAYLKTREEVRADRLCVLGHSEGAYLVVRIAASSPDVAGVTHLRRREVGPAGLSTYKKQGKRPVDAEVLSLIDDWLERQAS